MLAHTKQERRQTAAAATSGAEEGARLALKAAEHAARLREEARRERDEAAKKKNLTYSQKEKRKRDAGQQVRRRVCVCGAQGVGGVSLCVWLFFAFAASLPNHKLTPTCRRLRVCLCAGCLPCCSPGARALWRRRSASRGSMACLAALTDA